MASHAKLSPSASSRWIACPGSIRLTANIFSESGDAAYNGTIIHQAGENILLGKTTHAGISIAIEQQDGSTKMEWLAKDQYDEAQAYADYVRALVADTDDFELIPEMKVDLSYIAPDTFGHSDTVVIVDNTLHIVDLKTGAGLVSAKDNSQLMLYAYGAYLEYEFDYDIDTIKLHIVQNNKKTGGDKSNSHELTITELEEWIETVVKPAAEEALSDNAKCVPGEVQCKWCPAAASCEALIGEVEDMFDDVTEDHTDDLITDPKGIGEVVPMEKALRLYESMALINIWKKSVEDRIYRQLSEGKEVKGYKLVKKNKHKKWVDEEAAYNKLKSWEKLDDIAPRKLVTPTQAEKILGKVSTAKRNKFNELWIKPEGELTVAPESDRRPAEKTVVDDFEEL